MSVARPYALRRMDPRTEALHLEVHGIVTRPGGNGQGPFVVWDLSDNGLRLWLASHASAGDILKLTIAKPFVVMLSVEVRWCKAAADGSGFYVGVRALDNLPRLEALVRSVGVGDGLATRPAHL